MAHEVSTLHLGGGDLSLADAVCGAQLLHSGDIARLEINQALIEAVDLSAHHELSKGVLVVGGGGVHESF